MERLVDAIGTVARLRQRVSPQIAAILQRSAGRGFLGTMPISEQIDHALGFVFVAESVLESQPTSVVDLGAGGGVPGLILLPCWPDCRVVLLDSSERRTDFLEEETAGWTRNGAIEVVRTRAEEAGRVSRCRQHFELVVSRSFGAPAVTAECAAPLLSSGGLLVVSEPPDASAEDRWPESGLARVGLTKLVDARFDDRFGYQVMKKVAPTSDRYPRRVGAPSKRPLF